MTNEVMYRERTPFPGWARLILWGSLSAAALSFLAGRGAASSERVLAALGILAVGVGIETVLGGLVVEVRRHELFFGLGNAALLHKRIPYGDIERVEPVTYRPIREFGGWGIRGWGRRQAWTARGDQAVVLHLADGRQIYLGSDTPQRLAERIRQAMGMLRT